MLCPSGKISNSWRSIYKQKPMDGDVVASRRSGEAGYVSRSTYSVLTREFRTVEKHENRTVITVWHHDEWCYPEEMVNAP